MGATQTTNMLTSKLTVIALAVAAGLTAAYPASSVDYMTAPENEFVEARASTTCTPDPTQVYCINNVCQNTCAACPSGQGTECGAEEELVQAKASLIDKIADKVVKKLGSGTFIPELMQQPKRAIQCTQLD